MNKNQAHDAIFDLKSVAIVGVAKGDEFNNGRSILDHTTALPRPWAGTYGTLPGRQRPSSSGNGALGQQPWSSLPGIAVLILTVLSKDDFEQGPSA
jgi:hypothetical protein